MTAGVAVADGLISDLFAGHMPPTDVLYAMADFVGPDDRQQLTTGLFRQAGDVAGTLTGGLLDKDWGAVQSSLNQAVPSGDVQAAAVVAVLAAAVAELVRKAAA